VLAANAMTVQSYLPARRAFKIDTATVSRAEWRAKVGRLGAPARTPSILLESGHVLALNFPVGLNPGLARAVGVMLKLDVQRAVIQRIPKITAPPERVWRDLLFVCDEYHAFATVGETDPTGDERTFALSRQARRVGESEATWNAISPFERSSMRRAMSYP
jgi:hypothetical protein